MPELPRLLDQRRRAFDARRVLVDSAELRPAAKSWSAGSTPATLPGRMR